MLLSPVIYEAIWCRGQELKLKGRVGGMEEGGGGGEVEISLENQIKLPAKSILRESKTVGEEGGELMSL